MAFRIAFQKVNGVPGVVMLRTSYEDYSDPGRGLRCDACTRRSRLADRARLRELHGIALRFIDGPDEVHLRVFARNELRKAKGSFGRDALFFRNPGS